MSDEAPNLFEMRALHAALTGKDSWKLELAKQIPQLTVKERKDTIVGGFTTFSNHSSSVGVYISPDQIGYPPSINIDHPGLRYGGGAVVWTEGGRVARLEYFSNGNENWPEIGDNSVELFRFIRPSK
jgi:hypothetical protein